MSSSALPLPRETDSERELRWIAQAYEGVVHAREQAGRRIQSVCVERGREPTGAEQELFEPGKILSRIRRGESEGPLRLLGQAYRRLQDQELHVAQLLEAALEEHPAGPWLRQIRGVSSQASARLIARLDIRRAHTPDRLWEFCGLASHSSQGPSARKADPATKELCARIAGSICKAAGAYRELYHSEAETLRESMPVLSRRELEDMAARKIARLFLAHLWMVWRSALGLPSQLPPEAAAAEAPNPWTMTASNFDRSTDSSPT